MKTTMVGLITLAVLIAPLANAQVWCCSPIDNGRLQYHINRMGYPPHPDLVNGYGYGGGFGGGSRVGAVIAGSMAGAAIGGMVGGGRGMAIGAGIGAGVSGLADYAMNRAARGPKPRDCSKKKPGDRKCEAALAEAQAEAEMAERQALGKRLYNSTRWPVQILDCNQPVGQLQPRGSAFMPEARCSYVGVILTPDPATPGRTQRYEAAFRLTEDAATGWVFRAPENLGGGR